MNIQKAAVLELNLLRWLDLIPADPFEDALISFGVTISDSNGTELIHHVSLEKRFRALGFAEIGASDLFGALVVRVGQNWSLTRERLRALVKEAAMHAPAEIDLSRAKHRLVAFSYPKLAVQFYSGEGESEVELGMFELNTWNAVPSSQRRDYRQPISRFERWSIMDELPVSVRASNAEMFQNRLRMWDDLAEKLDLEEFPDVISAAQFEGRVAKPLNLRKEIVLKKIMCGTSSPCRDLGLVIHGQKGPFWCGPASLQMILEYFRYNFIQEGVADALGLATTVNSGPIPPGEEQRIVKAVENLAGTALSTSFIIGPNWNDFVQELELGHPIVSQISGHIRAVAGFSTARIKELGDLNLAGLVVFDPAPASEGTVTHWEDFGAIESVVRYLSNIAVGVKVI